MEIQKSKHNEKDILKWNPTKYKKGVYLRRIKVAGVALKEDSHCLRRVFFGEWLKVRGKKAVKHGCGVIMDCDRYEVMLGRFHSG